MDNFKVLTNQRDKLLTQIREIESACEGIENENNARRIQELNVEQARLTAQKKELSAKVSDIESKLSAINSEIAILSGTGIDRILKAIKKQRWFFFKNKSKVLMDRDTGLLWANLNYYNICKNDDCYWYDYNADYSEVKNMILTDSEIGICRQEMNL